jgi:hypothetical protein
MMTPSEAERERIFAEIARLLECLQTLPDPSYGVDPFEAAYVRAWQHWKSIETVVKDAAEWLSIAGFPTAFESKPWLQLQLAGNRLRAKSWPIEDVIRNLGFMQKRLLATVPPDLEDASISKEPSGTGARKQQPNPHTGEMSNISSPPSALTDRSRLAELDPTLGARARGKSQAGKKPPRRNTKYEAIDEALVDVSKAQPKNHEEVFRFLDGRKVPIPNRKPFKTAGGWLKGFQKDKHAASAWLSQVWARLKLPAFARGPKK